MFKRFLFTLLVLGSISFLLPACGQKKISSGSERRVRIPPNYDKSLCPVQPEEGDNANYENLSADDITQDPYFKKRYDRSDLNAVLSSSAVETTNYVLKMGISLFRVPETEGCPTYYALDIAPDPLLEQWNRIAGSGGEGLLAGIYFENCASPCLERQVINPTIMVRETSDRWTLVHEMMHHNFNVQRKTQTTESGLPQIRVEIERRTAVIENLLKSYSESRNLSLLPQTIREVDGMTEWLYKLLLQTNFEEMSVESLLLAQYSAGDFKKIPMTSAQSAAWYIGFSRKDAMRRFETLEELLRNLAKEADTQNDKNSIQLAQLAREKIKVIDERTQEVERDANKKVSNIPASALPRFSADFDLSNDSAQHLEHLEGYDQLQKFDSDFTRIRAAAFGVGD